jgi:3-oxoadipate enol-lactonase
MSLVMKLTFDHVPGHPSIGFVSSGRGTPVIFLHGIGGNCLNWIEQIKFFSSHHQAVAWDARGYLNSADYAGPCRFEDMSDDLVRLLNYLEVESAHFIGLSMGGRVLMDFGYRYPARVRSLVIAAAFPSFGEVLTPTQRQAYLRLRKEPLLAGKTFKDLAPQLVAALVGPNASDEVKRKLWDSIVSLRRSSYLKVLEATVDFDRRHEITLIRAATLLMYGECDHIVTPEQGRTVLALMPTARFLEVPKSGHLINLEAPDFFNQQVFQFISQNDVLAESTLR